ncbi:MAG: hypothetical protein ABR583_10665 [Gaiellaceae bacterium]
MSDASPDRRPGAAEARELSGEEMAGQQGEPLPAREVMSIVSPTGETDVTDVLGLEGRPGPDLGPPPVAE